MRTHISHVMALSCVRIFRNFVLAKIAHLCKNSHMSVDSSKSDRVWSRYLCENSHISVGTAANFVLVSCAHLWENSYDCGLITKLISHYVHKYVRSLMFMWELSRLWALHNIVLICHRITWGKKRILWDCYVPQYHMRWEGLMRRPYGRITWGEEILLIHGWEEGHMRGSFSIHVIFPPQNILVRGWGSCPKLWKHMREWLRRGDWGVLAMHVCMLIGSMWGHSIHMSLMKNVYPGKYTCK